MHRIFTFYLQTRSLREACRLAWGEDANKPVNVPGNVGRASIKWQWAARAQAYDEAESKKAKAEFERAKAEARKRRRKQNARVRALLDERLSQLGPKEVRRLPPHRAFAAVIQLNQDERVEYHELREDETRFDRGLPRLEDVVRPPENDEPEGGNNL